MPKRSTKSSSHPNLRTVEIGVDVADWLALRAENTGMPRAAVVREAVEAYKRSLVATPKPIAQVNATTTSAAGTRPDPKSFEAFIDMMGFCESCERDIRSYLDQYHLSHQWLIRKAVNGLFHWAPHQDGCPGQPLQTTRATTDEAADRVRSDVP